MDAQDQMKINIVDFEDWTVIYINGQSKGGDHRMDAAAMLKILGIEYEHEFIEFDPDEEIPDSYDELKRMTDDYRT